jgi:alkanesulfonate monooxygenase SsuD/methylene tetrahydromethanopterin reductase-like flavin-dependent oxidoreductase (luciferase family)
MASVGFGIFDHVDRGDEPLGTLYEQRLQLVEAADAAGFRTYHVAEHHATPLGMAPTPGIYLAAVAQRTRRLRFGPLVYLLPLYTPLRLIEEICMLDQLSGGRFELGVGRGISPYELAYSGVDFLAAQEIYEESLAIILAGLRGGRLTHHGRHYTYRGVPMELAPVQRPHPPLWQGVVRPDAAADAARRGVNIVSTLGSTALKPRGTPPPGLRPRWWACSAPSSSPTPTPRP